MRMPHRPRLLPLLNVIKYGLLLFLALMFMNFNVKIAQQSADTRAIAASTNGIVKNQGDILKAIRQVTEDTRITAAQQTSIIICMLQVPINERTTDLQAQCRKQASVSASGSAVGTGQSSGGIDSSGSSSLNTTPPSSTPQSNNVQQAPPAVQPSNVQKVVNGVAGVVNNVVDFIGGLL